MKNLIVLLLLTLSAVTNSYAQENVQLLTQDANGNYSFEEVIKVSAILTKEELFKRAKTWIVENMKTSDNNISIDEAEGTLNNTGALNIAPEIFSTYSIKSGSYDFKFHVAVKDGRYKYRIDNIMVYLVVQKERGFVGNFNASQKTMSYGDIEKNKPGRYIKEQINGGLTSFTMSFKSGMAKSTVKKNDW